MHCHIDKTNFFIDFDGFSHLFQDLVSKSVRFEIIVLYYFLCKNDQARITTNLSLFNSNNIFFAGSTMEKYFEIVDMIDDERRDSELFFYTVLKYKNQITKAWLPYHIIPSQRLLRNYYKRVFEDLSKSTNIDETSDKIYDLLYECKDSELESLTQKFLSVRGLLLPSSNQDKVFKTIRKLLREPSLCDTYLDTLRRDVLLEKLIKKRQLVLENLKICEWQVNMVSDNSKSVTVVNDVDLADFPSQLKYVNRYISNSDSIPTDVMSKCDCKATCTEKCTHDPDQLSNDRKTNASKKGSDAQPYDENGRILYKENKAVYECNAECECDETCPTRVVQNGANLKLQIFRTLNNCGWGVRTLEPILARTYVMRYAGEVIPWHEGNVRGLKSSAEYLFDMDFNFDPKEKHCPFTVDAYEYGNISRFVNHSCEPNLTVYSVYINNIHPEMPELAFFAKRDIEAGEELTIKYDKLVRKNNCRCAHCR